MITQLGLFALVGIFLIGLGPRLGRSAFLVAAIPPAVSLAWVGVRLPHVTSGHALSERTPWVGDLGLALDFRLDAMAATMTLIISGIGLVVLLYAREYFDPNRADLARIAGLLTLFAGSMVGLVLADHLLVLYTCWELTSVTSYLLIGNNHSDANARAAALHALLVTSAGGLAMLAGFVLLGHEGATFQISELAVSSITPNAPVVVALLLVMFGAFTKSAQYPFHAWLSGAMVAPTPVSAYLHSATMVKAGVYLIARFAPIFASVAVWRPIVLVVGLITFLIGGLRALRQHDLKLLLAFGTVSQLGLMVVLFGAGTPAATLAGWLLLVAHALFKGALFLVVGILDRVAGTRDIRRLPPLLGRGWRSVKVISAVSAASMAGLPLLAGFAAKEGAYTAFTDATFVGSNLVLLTIVAGSMLSFAYSARFYFGAFVAPRHRAREQSGSKAMPLRSIVTVTATLAVATVLLGTVPALGERFATAAVRSLDPAAGPANLALWHGFNLPLALSALTLAGGWLIGRANRTAQHTLALGSGILSGEEIYLRVLKALGRFARGVTAVVQNGSLPVYAAIILMTAVALPGGVLVASWEWPGWPAIGRLTDVPIVMVLAVAALGAATVRRRFSAAVFLGVTGYAMAALFVTFGAPDLALTQVVVETLSTVVFVLVLRRLPERFERQSSPRRRILRFAIAGIVGVVVFAFALVAAASRTATPISDEMIARSVPDGHGSNVVNVILVDFRALDTLGESAVLVAASIGAVALARVGRRAAEERAGGREMLAPHDSHLPRLVFLDVPARAIFYVVLMASLWLLFAGHNQPGGGFVGGLLAGAAITLRYVAGGIAEVRGRSRFRPWTVLGAGLLLAAITALLPLIGGGDILEVGIISGSIPVVGDLSLSSALMFDAGVYLAVVGMVLMAFEAFGQDPLEAAT